MNTETRVFTGILRKKKSYKKVDQVTIPVVEISIFDFVISLI